MWYFSGEQTSSPQILQHTLLPSLPFPLKEAKPPHGSPIRHQGQGRAGASCWASMANRLPDWENMQHTLGLEPRRIKVPISGFLNCTRLERKQMLPMASPSVDDTACWLAAACWVTLGCDGRSSQRLWYADGASRRGTWEPGPRLSRVQRCGVWCGSCVPGRSPISLCHQRPVKWKRIPIPPGGPGNRN